MLTKKRIIEIKDDQYQRKIIYEQICYDPQFIDLHGFCKRLTYVKIEPTDIMIEVSKEVNLVLSLLETLPPEEKKKRKKEKSTMQRQRQQQIDESSKTENEWNNYDQQLSKLLIVILQEKKYFPQILNFLKLSTVGDKYAIRLRFMPLVVGCAEMIIQVGTPGQYEHGTLEKCTLTDLILETVLALETITEQEEKNHEDLFFTMLKSQTKESLKKLFAVDSNRLQHADQIIIQRLQQLFVQYKTKSQYITFATLQKTRETILYRCRREAIYYLLNACGRNQYLFPEILLNLKTKQKPPYKGIIVAFNPMFLSILQYKKDLAEFAEENYLSILNDDLINYAMIEIYQKWQEKQNLDKTDFKILNQIILKLIDDLIDNFDKIGNRIRLIFQDIQFQEFFTTLKQNYANVDKNRTSYFDGFVIRAIESLSTLESKCKSYKYSQIGIVKPSILLGEVDFKFISYHYRIGYRKASIQFIQFLLRDLNSLEIPILEIVDLIIFNNDRFQFNTELEPILYCKFFCLQHISYYLERLYGIEIAIEENNSRINILHYPISNYGLAYQDSEENVIFAALTIISKKLKLLISKNIVLDQYKKKLIKLEESSNYTTINRNLKIKSVLQKILKLIS